MNQLQPNFLRSGNTVYICSVAAFPDPLAQGEWVRANMPILIFEGWKWGYIPAPDLRTFYELTKKREVKHVEWREFYAEAAGLIDYLEANFFLIGSGRLKLPHGYRLALLKTTLLFEKNPYGIAELKREIEILENQIQRQN